MYSAAYDERNVRVMELYCHKAKKEAFFSSIMVIYLSFRAGF